jgi:hypothetical protein
MDSASAWAARGWALRSQFEFGPRRSSAHGSSREPGSHNVRSSGPWLAMACARELVAS